MEEVDILYETKSGQTSELVASEGYRVFREVLDVGPPWDELVPGDRERWRDYSAKEWEICCREMEIGFRDLGKQLLEALMVPEEKTTLLAAEVAVRHMANLLMAEEPVDVRDALDFVWTAWAAKRTDFNPDGDED